MLTCTKHCGGFCRISIALAMARICNAADRPRPRLHTREEVVNTFYQVTPAQVLARCCQRQSTRLP